MMYVEVFGPSEPMMTVAATLDGLDGVSRVRRIEATRQAHSVVVASARPSSVDRLLGELQRLGVSEDEISISRVERVDWTATREAESSLVWADVLGQAWSNSRPIARYLTLMFVAGAIAGYGVLDANAILIVGAMAVSPDLLPITAIGVGVVSRKPRLAGGALLTLVVGLAVTSATAALFTIAQDLLDLLPAGFDLSSSDSVLGHLTSVTDETIVVAFVAGMAGMLSLETRASSAVGVGVSVTTIPAAAYLGVAAGLGMADTALGTLAVLGMNVTMMALGASVTLVVQRLLKRRNAADRRPRSATPPGDPPPR